MGPPRFVKKDFWRRKTEPSLEAFPGTHRLATTTARSPFRGLATFGLRSARYLYLAFLLILVMLGTAILEGADAEPKTVLSHIQQSELGPYLIAAPLAWALVLLTAPGSISRFARVYVSQPSRAARGLLVMFGIGLAIPVVLCGVLAVTGHAAWDENGDAGRIGVVLQTTVLSILLALIVAVSEELVFRGFVTSYLRWNASQIVSVGAVASSALAYALAHNLSDPAAWLTADDSSLLVGLFSLGVLLAVSYLASRSLWCPIGLHAALVAFDLAILQGDVISLDLSPWWLGSGGDIREAPALWLAFGTASAGMIMARSWLKDRLAVEPSFVGWLMIPNADRGHRPPVETRVAS
jgi:membrane protease YdiL (CAAX protease family)